MIYIILKILARLTLYGYFRKLTVVGKEHIPKKGPYIFIANHPSAFMDPVVIASLVRPSIYFIAAGEYVGKGIKGWFFKTMLHMIPVYRPSTRPGEMHKNKDMFIRCHEHLLGKGALLIFPEGVSLTEKKLKPLKTGTARIALGAERKSNFKIRVPIIPIGLNYSDPHQFRSDLFVNIGKPVYTDEFGKLTAENEMELARQVTSGLEQQLSKSILHVETPEEELMLDKLGHIYARDLKAQLDIAFENQEGEFNLHKNFTGAIRFFKQNNPTVYAETETKTDNYLATLKKHKLTDKDIGEFEERKEFKRFFSYILGFPYFVFGIVHNYLPYRLVGFISKLLKAGETFSGSITLALGLFIFTIWYTLLTVFAVNWFGWYGLIYPILIYVGGIYALLYTTAISHSQQRNRLRKFCQENQELCAQLIEDRKTIISLLTRCRKEYIEAQASPKSSLHQ